MRKLTVVVCADVVGFSSMMGADEDTTVKSLKECRDIIDSKISAANGRIFNTAGDSVLSEFTSVLAAVEFAIDCQLSLYFRLLRQPEVSPMRFRMGINLGDVIVQGTDLVGDCVNIAARLESQAEYGGVNISNSVYLDVHRHLKVVKFIDCGEQQFKNIEHLIRVYSIDIPGAIKNTKIATTETVAVDVNQTLAQASAYRTAGAVKKAVAIYLALAMDGNHVALDILMNMANNNRIPNNQLLQTYAVFVKHLPETTQDNQKQIMRAFIERYSYQSTNL